MQSSESPSLHQPSQSPSRSLSPVGTVLEDDSDAPPPSPAPFSEEEVVRIAQAAVGAMVPRLDPPQREDSKAAILDIVTSTMSEADVAVHGQDSPIIIGNSPLPVLESSSQEARAFLSILLRTDVNLFSATEHAYW